MTVTREDDAKRLALYHAGLSDPAIARELGLMVPAVYAWRKRRGLPTRPGGHRELAPDADAARLLLYQMGYSDRRIAREQGRAWTSVQKWRKRRNLPVHGLSRANWRTADLVKDSTLDRIKRAIGRALPRDIADDAVGELYLAVLEGTVSLDRIKAEARRYGNRVLNAFASGFGPRSLDEELGDAGDGFRMIDFVVDERHSSWLEEMGATVC